MSMLKMINPNIIISWQLALRLLGESPFLEKLLVEIIVRTEMSLLSIRSSQLRVYRMLVLNKS